MKKTFVVPDIKPLDLYDCTKAKICASVGWLLAKSYGSAGGFIKQRPRAPYSGFLIKHCIVM